MKIKSVYIKNIASIEEEFVDFTQRPFVDTPLFLISGKMGTGKTTLLDAICLALYNNTPSYAKGDSTKRDYNNSENLTGQDPRHILRHGTKEGKAEVVFVGNDGKDYTATWEVKRNRNNNLNDAKQTLTVDGKTEERSTIIKKIIVSDSSVGLTFDEFCRTTVLAQGEVDKFLTANEGERASILEKLTNTSCYSAVGNIIAQKTNAAKKSMDNAEIKANAIQCLSETDRQALSDEIKNFEQQLPIFKTNEDNANQSLQWFTQKGTHESNIICQETKLSEQKAVTQTPEFKQEECTKNDFRASEQGRNALVALNMATKEQKELSQDVNDLSQSFDRLFPGKVHFENTLNENRTQLQQTQSELDADAPYTQIFDNIQTIDATLNQVEALKNDINTNTSNAQQLAKDLPALKQNIVERNNTLKEIETQLQQEKENKNAITQAIAALNPQQITSHRQQLNSQQELLSNADNRLGTLNNKLTLLNNAQKELLELNENIQSKESEKKELISPIAKAQEEYDNAKRLFEEAQLKVGDAAKQLRAQLHVGDKCPVCGHTYDTSQVEEKLQKLFDGYKQDCKDKEEKLKNLNGKYLGIENTLTDYKDQRPNREMAVTNAKEELDAALLAAQNVCNRLNIILHDASEVEISNAQNQRQELAQTLAQEQNALAEKERDLDKKNGELATANEAITLLQEQQGNAQTELTNANNAVENNQKEQERLAEENGRIQDTINTNLDNLNQFFGALDWRPQYNAHPLAFANEWHQRATDFQKRIKRKENLKQTIDLNSPILQNISNNIDSIRTFFPSLVINNQVDPVSIANIEQEFANLNTLATRLHTQIESNNSRISSENQKLETFLQQHPTIDRQRLEELCNLSQQDIADIEKRHDAANNEIHNTEGALESEKQQLKNHLDTPHPAIPDNATQESLKEAYDQARKATFDCSDSLSSRKTKLETDDANRTENANAKAEFDSAQKKYNDWNELQILFGTSNGDAFRKIAQSLLFENILENANRHLQNLDRRYRMTCIENSLAIALIDQYTPGAPSTPVASLSGGQRFLCALSLALAMTSLNNKEFNIDTLFIDEGFGSLDASELPRVITLLESLQQQLGKRVGIISHVETLAQRIPIQIEAFRTSEQAPSHYRFFDKSISDKPLPKPSIGQNH